MNARSLRLLLAATLFAFRATAGEDVEPAKPPPTAHEMLNALIREEAAKKQAAAGATAASATKSKDDAKPASAAKPGEKDKADKTEAGTAKDAKPRDEIATARTEPATVLPKVQVNQSRLTEIDRQIYEQDKAIAKQKEATKPTELDKALNDPKVSKLFSIFGGESSSQRATVAGERVKIMDEEKDLLEALKTAKTKEEKAGLQQQLVELRAYRRELEKLLR